MKRWKTRDGLEVPKKSKTTIDAVVLDDEDDASSDEGKKRPTPNSVTYSKPIRQNEGKHA